MLKILTLFISISAAFASNECLTITDSLDREYCFKKSLRSEELKLEAELTTLKKSLSKAKKELVLSDIENNLEINKEETNYLLKKQNLMKSHKEKVAKLAITQSTKKKKKKNKLKDSLKKLGIKF